MHSVFEDKLGGTVLETQLLQPLTVEDAPALTVWRRINLTTQEELADAVADPGQVDAQVLATADQIAQLLFIRFRDADQPKLDGAQQTRQPDCVALVDLDVVGSVLQDVAGRANNDIKASRARSLRASPYPVGPASYTARNGGATVASHSTTCSGRPMMR